MRQLEQGPMTTDDNNYDWLIALIDDKLIISSSHLHRNIMADVTEGGFAKLCINLWKTWATPLKACNPKWQYFGLLQ